MGVTRVRVCHCMDAVLADRWLNNKMHSHQRETESPFFSKVKRYWGEVVQVAGEEDKGGGISQNK
jgi:hypothetical protein